MIVAVLYFVFFVVLFSRYWKGKRFSLSTLILLCYLVSALLTLLEFSHGSNNSAYLSPLATFYYVACVFISLLPFLSLGNLNCKDFKYCEPLLLGLSYILILFGLVDVINSIYFVGTNFNTFLYNIASVRENYYSDVLDQSIRLSTFDAIGTYARSIQYMSIFCGFYFRFTGRRKLSTLLFICSVSAPLSGMVNGARGPVLTYVANLCFCLIFYKPEMLKSDFRRIRNRLLVFSAPLVIYFVAMTIGRFSGSSYDSNPITSLFSYGGDMPYFFTRLFDNPSIAEQALNGRFCFQWLFPSGERAWQQLNNYISADFYLNQFGGLPGSFFLDFGYYTILAVALFAILYGVLIKRASVVNAKYPFYLLFLFYFSFQVLFTNIFYFYYAYPSVLYTNILFFVATIVYPRLIKK